MNILLTLLIEGLILFYKYTNINIIFLLVGVEQQIYHPEVEFCFSDGNTVVVHLTAYSTMVLVF